MWRKCARMENSRSKRERNNFRMGYIHQYTLSYQAGSWFTVSA